MLLNNISKAFDKVDSNDKMTKSNDLDDSSDIKSLLVNLTKTLNSQREEIEALKRQQKDSTNQLKNQIDSTLKQLQKQSFTSATSNIDEANIQQISLSITTQMLPKLDKIIKEEINKSVQTQFSTRLLDQIREQISRDLADKLKSLDATLKDTVSKLFKSKSTLDSINQSVVSPIQVNKTFNLFLLHSSTFICNWENQY